MFEDTAMTYAQVDNLGVEEDAPLIYMIHINRRKSRDLFVGSAARGSDLPRRGQLWTAQSLLQDDPPFPDWFYRCQPVHFAMAEAWLQGDPIKLVLIGNTSLSQIEADRKRLEATLQPQLNTDLPTEVTPFFIRLRMLKFKALDRFSQAKDPKELKARAPQLWEAACQGHADMNAIPVREAEKTLKRQFCLW